MSIMAPDLAEVFIISILTGIFASLFVYIFSLESNLSTYKFGLSLIVTAGAILLYGILYLLISKEIIHKIINYVGSVTSQGIEEKLLVALIWLVTCLLLIL